MKSEIFMEGNIPSSKNSKQIYRFTDKLGTLKTVIGNSKTVEKYKEKYLYQWKSKKKLFLNFLKNKEKPYKIGFYFIRDSRRKFDYINAAQLPLDLMQEFKWIEDDDTTNIIPVFLGYEIDKERAGLILSVL